MKRRRRSHRKRNRQRLAGPFKTTEAVPTRARDPAIGTNRRPRNRLCAPDLTTVQPAEVREKQDGLSAPRAVLLRGIRPVDSRTPFLDRGVLQKEHRRDLSTYFLGTIRFWAAGCLKHHPAVIYLSAGPHSGACWPNPGTRALNTDTAGNLGVSDISEFLSLNSRTQCFGLAPRSLFVADPLRSAWGMPRPLELAAGTRTGGAP